MKSISSFFVGHIIDFISKTADFKFITNWISLEITPNLLERKQVLFYRSKDAVEWNLS